MILLTWYPQPSDNTTRSYVQFKQLLPCIHNAVVMSIGVAMVLWEAVTWSRMSRLQFSSDGNGMRKTDVWGMRKLFFNNVCFKSSWIYNPFMTCLWPHLKKYFRENRTNNASNLRNVAVSLTATTSAIIFNTCLISLLVTFVVFFFLREKFIRIGNNLPL